MSPHKAIQYLWFVVAVSNTEPTWTAQPNHQYFIWLWPIENLLKSVISTTWRCSLYVDILLGCNFNYHASCWYKASHLSQFYHVEHWRLHNCNNLPFDSPFLVAYKHSCFTCVINRVINTFIYWIEIESNCCAPIAVEMLRKESVVIEVPLP